MNLILLINLLLSLLCGHTAAYSYDAHGNVNTLLQDIPELASLHPASGTAPGNIFRIDYKYDLVSGNVNEVAYQKGVADQFLHKYYYDADNRITSVYTSKDGAIWDKDADSE